ncbi:MAG: hypothetical protein QXI12_10705 [Candidatus Methanomethyliaceae archaeon]
MARIGVQYPTYLVYLAFLVSIISCSERYVQTSQEYKYPAPPSLGTLGKSSIATPFHTPTIDPRLFKPIEAPEPQPGMSSISGIIYSFTISRTLPNTFFYLVRAKGTANNILPPILTGPEENEGDISATTDSEGQISLNNITPGNYFIAVSTPYSWSVVVTSDKDFTPRLIELKANKKYSLGLLFVSWP